MRFRIYLFMLQELLMKRLSLPATRLALSALAALSLLASAPAHALGRLADIQVLDRDHGVTLPVYRHQGSYWVAGHPGARYAVSVRNTTGGRVLGVISVDGVNVVSGETASWEQTGYVLAPGQAFDITGWRKSDSEIAAFHFTASQGSYAARTGRPDHVGVIGVAVFREKLPPPPPPPPLVPYTRPRTLPESGDWSSPQGRPGAASGAPSDKVAAPAPAPSFANEASARSADSASPPARREGQPSQDAVVRAMPAPRLGTGHGERETSRVGHTEFERRSNRPDEIIRIRYDSRENLIAMGVIPGVRPPPSGPNPFPDAPALRYVPDPPSR
jgi:hypothetical protein